MTERKGKQAMEMRGAKRLRVSGQKAPNNNTERVYPGYRNLSSYYTIFTSLLFSFVFLLSLLFVSLFFSKNHARIQKE